MAKKSNPKVVSIQYENENGELHLAIVQKHDNVKNNKKALDDPPVGICNCGEEICFKGIKYKCLKDPFGDCVWFTTTERC